MIQWRQFYCDDKKSLEGLLEIKRSATENDQFHNSAVTKLTMVTMPRH